MFCVVVSAKTDFFFHFALNYPSIFIYFFFVSIFHRALSHEPCVQLQVKCTLEYNTTKTTKTASHQHYVYMRHSVCVCASSVIHNSVSALDGNVHCDQQSMTSGAEFPYCTTNTPRQSTALNRLFIFPSKYIQWAHHMLWTDMHWDSLLFYIFWWYANQPMRGKCDSFQIHQTAFWPSSHCALSPVQGTSIGITASWGDSDWQVHWHEIPAAAAAQMKL